MVFPGMTPLTAVWYSEAFLRLILTKSPLNKMTYSSLIPIVACAVLYWYCAVLYCTISVLRVTVAQD